MIGAFLLWLSRTPINYKTRDARRKEWKLRSLVSTITMYGASRGYRA